MLLLLFYGIHRSINGTYRWSISSCVTVLNHQACVEIMENKYKTMCLVLSVAKIVTFSNK